MIDFVDEGEILRRSDLPWTEATDIHNKTKSELTFMWAPDTVYKDGYYYFYKKTRTPALKVIAKESATQEFTR